MQVFPIGEASHRASPEPGIREIVGGCRRLLKYAGTFDACPHRSYILYQGRTQKDDRIMPVSADGASVRQIPAPSAVAAQFRH